MSMFDRGDGRGQSFLDWDVDPVTIPPEVMPRPKRKVTAPAPETLYRPKLLTHLGSLDINKVYQMDCFELLAALPSKSVDAVICDGPYNISYLGRAWDSTGILYDADMWRECLRVLKPGGHLLSFAASRTYHRMAVAIEDAGFEIRGMIDWLYSSGFPVSQDISKQIDKMYGAERGQLRYDASQALNPKVIKGGVGIPGGDSPWMIRAREVGYHVADGPIPVTEEAARWFGWGSGLKPCHEPVCWARKPLSESNIARNILRWGTGGINVMGCRILDGRMMFDIAGDGTRFLELQTDGKYRIIVPVAELRRRTRWPVHAEKDNRGLLNENGTGATSMEWEGRWPGDVIFDPAMADMLDEQVRELREIEPEDVEDMPEATPSRFFMVSKPGESEKKYYNTHLTIKPVSLMRYLIRLVTPPGGAVVDQFCGSGSTLVAARREGVYFLGGDMSEEYVQIARKRLLEEKV